jgi:hypothetical protein
MNEKIVNKTWILAVGTRYIASVSQHFLRYGRFGRHIWRSYDRNSTNCSRDVHSRGYPLPKFGLTLAFIDML